MGEKESVTLQWGQVRVIKRPRIYRKQHECHHIPGRTTSERYLFGEQHVDKHKYNG